MANTGYHSKHLRKPNNLGLCLQSTIDRNTWERITCDFRCKSNTSFLSHLSVQSTQKSQTQDHAYQFKLHHGDCSILNCQLWIRIHRSEASVDSTGYGYVCARAHICAHREVYTCNGDSCKGCLEFWRGKHEKDWKSGGL